MSNKTKEYLKIIGIECVFMIFTIIIAGICCAIQFIGKKYVEHWSGSVFNGDVYRYNYVMYVIGILLYFVSLIFVYKKLLSQVIGKLVNYHYLLIIIAWILCPLWVFIMLYSQLIIATVNLNLWNNMESTTMILVTIIGWPIISGILFTFYIIKSLIKMKHS